MSCSHYRIKGFSLLLVCSKFHHLLPCVHIYSLFWGTFKVLLVAMNKLQFCYIDVPFHTIFTCNTGRDEDYNSFNTEHFYISSLNQGSTEDIIELMP